MKEYRERHSIAFPILLIAIGLVILLVNIGGTSVGVWDIVARYWPALLIIFGLDSIYRREGFVGGLFSVAVGIIFLLSTLGYLDLQIWEIIFRYWPVLIIVLGLDILLGWGRGPSVWKAALGILAVFVLIAGIFWLTGVQTSREASQIRIEQNYEGATSGVINISAATGNLTIGVLPVSNSLIQGVVSTSQREDIIQEYNLDQGTAEFSLESQGTGFMPFAWNSPSREWELQITPAIPIRLEVSLPVGVAEIDLSELNLDELQITTVIGMSVVTLPKEGIYAGDINGVIGNTTILVPRSMPARFHINRGITVLEIDTEFGRDGDDEYVYSPTAQNANSSSEIVLSQPIGRLEIKMID